ncbi:MAG: hypothetical protein LBB94_02675 [Clostridiales bacterium]|jgi:hypothetical protein|nr:hypothetical protein [Clostridiales bacterium]
MAHARKRHYRVARKAAEAQVCQREDGLRRDTVLTSLIVIVLITQILNLALRIYDLFSDGETD